MPSSQLSLSTHCCRQCLGRRSLCLGLLVVGSFGLWGHFHWCSSYHRYRSGLTVSWCWLFSVTWPSVGRRHCCHHRWWWLEFPEVIVDEGKPSKLFLVDGLDDGRVDRGQRRFLRRKILVKVCRVSSRFLWQITQRSADMTQTVLQLQLKGFKRINKLDSKPISEHGVSPAVWDQCYLAPKMGECIGP